MQQETDNIKVEISNTTDFGVLINLNKKVWNIFKSWFSKGISVIFVPFLPYFLFLNICKNG